MAHKVLVVSLCTMLGVATLNLSGCAQFEDSFGELRGSDNQYGDVGKPPHDNLVRTYDRPSGESSGKRRGQPDNERSYSIAGVRFELDPGAVTQ